jgi:pilus assembly protein Flp/PilA
MMRKIKEEVKMFKKVMKFFKGEDGVTSVEYAVMAALIALVVIAGATLLGQNTNDTFNTVGAAIPGSGS